MSCWQVENVHLLAGSFSEVSQSPSLRGRSKLIGHKHEALWFNWSSDKISLKLFLNCRNRDGLLGK